MTDLERFARNQRFSGIRSCIITDCGGGNLALFEWGGTGNLLYLGDDPAELMRVFSARPEWSYRPAPPAPKVINGIDTSSLTFNI